MFSFNQVIKGMNIYRQQKAIGGFAVACRKNKVFRVWKSRRVILLHKLCAEIYYMEED